MFQLFSGHYRKLDLNIKNDGVGEYLRSSNSREEYNNCLNISRGHDQQPLWSIWIKQFETNRFRPLASDLCVQNLMSIQLVLFGNSWVYEVDSCSRTGGRSQVLWHTPLILAL